MAGKRFFLLKIFQSAQALGLVPGQKGNQMEYADNLRKIDDIQKGGDYFKATIQLGDLAAELAAKLYKLQMTVAIKDGDCVPDEYFSIIPEFNS
jgi:hypothetical protein